MNIIFMFVLRIVEITLLSLVVAGIVMAVVFVVGKMGIFILEKINDNINIDRVKDNIVKIFESLIFEKREE